MKIEKYTSDFIDGNANFSIKLLLVWLAPLVPATILFIANAISIKIFANHLWINHLLFWFFAPIILWSLFAAQKNNLVGASGETIILLIPTFIWLLPGHSKAISLMITLSFTIIVISVFLYFLSLGLKYAKTKNIKRKKMLSHIFMKMAFVFASVVSTLVISIIFINWGDHSMKWAYVYDNDGQIIFDQNKEIMKDYTSTSYISFISVTTIMVAILLVSLGLLTSFNKHFKRQNNISATQAFFSKFKPKTKSLIEKTKIIKLPKKIKKQK